MASKAWQIVDAVRNVIKALTIPNVPTANVVIRKEFVHDKGFSRKPGIVVVGLLEEQGDEENDGHTNLFFPVLVGLEQDRNIREADAQWEMDARQELRIALKVTSLPGVDGLCGVRYDPKPEFDSSSWGELYLLSAQLFVYQSDEAG